MGSSAFAAILARNICANDVSPNDLSPIGCKRLCWCKKNLSFAITCRPKRLPSTGDFGHNSGTSSKRLTDQPSSFSWQWWWIPAAHFRPGGGRGTRHPVRGVCQRRETAAGYLGRLCGLGPLPVGDPFQQQHQPTAAMFPPRPGNFTLWIKTLSMSLYSSESLKVTTIRWCYCHPGLEKNVFVFPRFTKAYQYRSFPVYILMLFL